jgi:CHAT domain
MKGKTMRRRLLDFDVAVESYGDGYRTHVVASPGGQAQADFALPVSDTDLEIFVLKVGMSIGRSRRKARRIESEERRLLEDFGDQLYRAVFSGSVRECLDRSLSIARSKDAGLRIRLRLPGALANIPWEYLHDDEYGFLGLSAETALVRYLEMPKPPRPFSISPPLRILAMISAPSDVSELQGEEEWVKLNDALSDLVRQGMVQVDRTEAGTLSALQRPLRNSDYHVLHFVGHGGFDEQAQDGALALEGADRKTRLATGRDLWVMLQAHRSLRLVVLNACEGARSARDDPFGGVAQALVRLGVPAVIAMQFEISDLAALMFSQSFYQAIADGLPVDVAAVEARIAMFAGGNEVEWATPVLYLRSPDGRVFTRNRLSEAERLAREQAERLAREQREQAEREAQERRERAERQAREQAQRQAREQREQTERQAREQAQRQTQATGNAMGLPPLTPEQRAAALAKAAAARKERADVKNRLKRGVTTLPQVLKEGQTDDVVGKMKVSALLESMPGVGKIRANQIMERLGIGESRRVRGLSANQRTALEHEFGGREI